MQRHNAKIKKLSARLAATSLITTGFMATAAILCVGMDVANVGLGEENSGWGKAAQFFEGEVLVSGSLFLAASLTGASAGIADYFEDDFEDL